MTANNQARERQDKAQERERREAEIRAARQIQRDRPGISYGEALRIANGMEPSKLAAPNPTPTAPYVPESYRMVEWPESEGRKDD